MHELEACGTYFLMIRYLFNHKPRCDVESTNNNKWIGNNASADSYVKMACWTTFQYLIETNKDGCVHIWQKMDALSSAVFDQTMALIPRMRDPTKIQKDSMRRPAFLCSWKHRGTIDTATNTTDSRLAMGTRGKVGFMAVGYQREALCRRMISESPQSTLFLCIATDSLILRPVRHVPPSEKLLPENLYKFDLVL